MKQDLNVVRMLRIAAALWMIYLLALAVIEHLVLPRPVLSPGYYIINGFCALLVLALALWPWAQRELGQALMPVAIVLMSAVPIISNHILPPLPAPGPVSSLEALALRLLPVLILALLLTAWQYAWPYVIAFSLGTALLNLGFFIVRVDMKMPAFSAALLAIVIETVTFLMVGLFISYLVSQLRTQQASLEAANTQLTHYASTLESLTISRERNRMARELHDTLAHTLSGLSVQLETVKAYWDVDPATAQNQLEKSIEETRQGVQETRRALKALRASPLDDLGLTLAIRQLAESAAQSGNLTLDLSMPEQLPPLSPDVEQCLYRVAQEAVANVVYHANAEHLRVHLSYNGDGMSLLVQDDGRGFDVKQVGRQSGHFGLPGMGERAELVGGEFTVESEPGQGTTIRLRIKD